MFETIDSVEIKSGVLSLNQRDFNLDLIKRIESLGKELSQLKETLRVGYNQDVTINNIEKPLLKELLERDVKISLEGNENGVSFGWDAKVIEANLPKDVAINKLTVSISDQTGKEIINSNKISAITLLDNKDFPLTINITLTTFSDFDGIIRYNYDGEVTINSQSTSVRLITTPVTANIQPLVTQKDINNYLVSEISKVKNMLK